MGGYFSPYQNPQLPDGPEGEHLTVRLAAEAVSFIESNRDRPFLLYLPFYAVHFPIQARPELIAKYTGAEARPWPASSGLRCHGSKPRRGCRTGFGSTR